MFLHLLIPLPGQQHLWHWRTAGVGFICFHLAQFFMPSSSALGGYHSWSRDHNETQSVIRTNSSAASGESKRRMNLTKRFERAWGSGFTLSARKNDFQRSVPDHQPWGIKSWRVLLFIHGPSDFHIKLKGSVSTRCNPSVLFPADMGDEEKGLATTQTSQGPSPHRWKKQGSWT